jgi:hypothetical protein
MKCLIFSLICLVLCGCTGLRKKMSHLVRHQSKTETALGEESRALTTAVVDSLQFAPTNQATSLALDLARHDQQIEGLPLQRIDVAGVLAGEPGATNALGLRFEKETRLSLKGESGDSNKIAPG